MRYQFHLQLKLSDELFYTSAILCFREREREREREVERERERERESFKSSSLLPAALTSSWCICHHRQPWASFIATACGIGTTTLKKMKHKKDGQGNNRGWLFLFGGLFSLFLAIPAIAVAPAVAAGAGAAQAAAGAAAAAAAAIAFLGLHRLIQKSGWFSQKRSDVQDVRVRHCT